MSTKNKKDQEVLEFPSSYHIFAADLSLRCPGFCKMTIINKQIVDVQTSYVNNKNNITDHGELLNNIGKAMTEKIPADDLPVYFVREKAFNARASMAEIGIYKVIGIVDWINWQLRQKDPLCSKWYEVFPVTVKKAVTGSGKADKLQVQKALSNYIGERQYEVDDESDSVAVALAFLIQNDQIESKPLDEFKPVETETNRHVSKIDVMRRENDSSNEENKGD